MKSIRRDLNDPTDKINVSNQEVHFMSGSQAISGCALSAASQGAIGNVWSRDGGCSLQTGESFGLRNIRA